MPLDAQAYKLLIQSFISPRGRDVAAIHSVVADFATYNEAQQAAALIDAQPTEAFPHTKVLRLYPLDEPEGD